MSSVNIKKLLDNNGVLYLWSKIKGLPISTFTNDAEYITEDDLPDEITASSTNPVMNGTASCGVSTSFARGDHVHPSDTSKVDAVEGKGLSTNDFTNAYKGQLDNLNTTINTAVASAGHITKSIVQTLPAVASAQENVIYLVPNADGGSGNVYDEYMLINGAFEKTGSSDIDLSDYLKTTDIATITNAEIDTICV